MRAAMDRANPEMNLKILRIKRIKKIKRISLTMINGL